MKVEAQLKNLRITPRKVRMLAYSLRGIGVSEALIQLEKQVKKSSLPLAKLLRSAVANAQNRFGLGQDDLYVSNVIVNDGTRLKRWMPRAQGRATPIVRRLSHVRFVLESVEGTEVSSRSEQTETKEKATDTEGTQEKKSVKTAKKTIKNSRKAAVSKVSRQQGAKGSKKIFQRKSV